MFYGFRPAEHWNRCLPQEAASHPITFQPSLTQRTIFYVYSFPPTAACNIKQNKAELVFGVGRVSAPLMFHISAQGFMRVPVLLFQLSCSAKAYRE
jgi:hypothetical protein